MLPASSARRRSASMWWRRGAGAGRWLRSVTTGSASRLVAPRRGAVKRCVVISPATFWPSLKTSFGITTNERQSYGGGLVKGTTYKRCKCPPRFNAAGKRLACPKKHGRWAYALAVPLSDERRVTLGRPQVTRSGFATQEAASAELRQVIQLLEIPDADDDGGRMEIAEMIRDAYRRYRQLPEYDDVRRRFAAGVSLVRHQTT